LIRNGATTATKSERFDQRGTPGSFVMGLPLRLMGRLLP
jgi:hypothetical protein